MISSPKGMTGENKSARKSGSEQKSQPNIPGVRTIKLSTKSDCKELSHFTKKQNEILRIDEWQAHPRK